MKVKKTVIIMGYECNNNCIFCCHSDRRGKIRAKSTKTILADILVAKKAGTAYLELIGGEPTIRKDIFAIISYAKRLNFKTIMFATNGRMFSSMSFCKKILNSGVNHIVFSIHGHNAREHDKLTRVKGSFDELMMGIKNLRTLGFNNIGSNTTIVKQNYMNLNKIGNMLYKLNIKNAEFIFVDPTYGFSTSKINKVVPTCAQISDNINRLLKFGYAKKIHHWHIRYYPLCFINEKFHSRVSEILDSKYFETIHKAPDFHNIDVAYGRANVSRIKLSKCTYCKYGDRCEGFWKKMIEENG